MLCPKCDEEQPRARACRRCGLLAEHFQTFAERSEAAVSPALARAWSHCLEHWEEESAHEAFIERVVAAGAYAYAARQYRAHLRERQGDARAAHYLQRIRQMAEAAVLSTPPSRREGGQAKEPYRTSVGLLVALAVLACAGVAYAVVFDRGEPAPTEEGEIAPPEPEIYRQELPREPRTAPPRPAPEPN